MATTKRAPAKKNTNEAIEVTFARESANGVLGLTFKVETPEGNINFRCFVGGKNNNRLIPSQPKQFNGEWYFPISGKKEAMEWLIEQAKEKASQY